MSRTKLFRVVGVNRQNGRNVDVHVEALSVDNAKVKTETQGVNVTSVRPAKRDRLKPAIKVWQFQTLRSTGFDLPRRVTIWFALLIAFPAAIVNKDSPLNMGVSEAHTFGTWLGVWCVYAVVIHAAACVPAYFAWRLLKQDRRITGNVYIAAAVVLAILLLYTIGISVGRSRGFMN